MLAAIRGAQSVDHVRDLHLLVGRDRRAVHRRAVRARARRRPGQRHGRLGRQHQDGRGAARTHGGGGRARRALPPAALVQPRPPQQPHPPQAAGRGRRASASPAAWASPTSGRATRRIRITGATSHFRIEGPAVAQMQAAFNDNWIKTTGEVLNGADYFPPLERPATMDAHLFIARRPAAARACT